MPTLKNLSIKMRVQLTILFTVLIVSIIITTQSIINIQNLTQENIAKYKKEAYANKGLNEKNGCLNNNYL